MREFEMVDRNLRRALEFYGTADGSGGVTEQPGLRLVCSGLDYPTFNTALLSDPQPIGGGDLDDRVARAAMHFARIGVRWSCWICNDVLESRARRKMHMVFHERGFRPLFEPPGMLAERLLAPIRPLPQIEVRKVGDEQTRLAFCHVTSLGFDIPFPVSRQIYGGERAWHGHLTGYVGFLNGNPVTTTATVAEADAVGIYSVATLPPFQRRGLAERTMRYALEQARVATGIERTVLQSSAMGLRLYERMGYKTVTRFSVWLSC